MGSRRVVSLAVWSFCPIFVAMAFFSTEAASPRLGVALSGGGARGMAHIGVLRVLEENRIPISAIGGTSIGAFVGALYASGYSLDEIEKIFESIDWDDLVFNDRIARRDLPLRKKIDDDRYLFDFEMGFRDGAFRLPPGLVYGQKMSLLLDSLFLRQFENRDFSKLPIPFKAVASDLETGKQVILDKGNLADAIRASTAYPGLFSPVEVEGRLLLDGGSVNNLPVDLVRAMNVDFVLAVDVSAPLNGRDKLSSFVDISDQIVTMMMRRTTEAQLQKADLQIVPKIEFHETFAFDDQKKLTRIGYDALKEKISVLKRFAVSEAAYEKQKQWREASGRSPQRIDRVESLGFKRVDTRTIESRVHLKANQDFDLGQLKRDLTKIYSMGDFERADFEVIKDKAETVLRLRAIEKRWGPTYIHFGVSWDGEIKGKQDGNAVMNIQATRLNALNAEWVTDVTMGTVLELETEFFQPLDYRGLFFLAPTFNAVRTDQDVYAETNRVAEYEIDSVVGGADFGVALGSVAELRAGLRRGFLNSEVELGANTIPSYEVQTGSWLARFRLDTLDHFYFPQRGFYLSGDFVSTHEILGADVRYHKIHFQASAFHTWNRFTPFLQFEGGGNLKSEIPDYDLFMLGGLRSLGGFRNEELRGQIFGVLRSGALMRLPLPRNFFWNRVYLGGWYEGGNVFEKRSEISVSHLKHSGTGAIAFETKLGALFLAYGQSGSENKQFYVSVGRPFGIRQTRVY